jgi:hypothetical protein
MHVALYLLLFATQWTSGREQPPPAIFAVVACVAALAPVLRALRINPATALRWE